MGDNCILGAGSLLNFSMPSNTVYAGVPAKFICTTEEFANKCVINSAIYPLKLEEDRKDLDEYLRKHLPHKYKPHK